MLLLHTARLVCFQNTFDCLPVKNVQRTCQSERYRSLGAIFALMGQLLVKRRKLNELLTIKGRYVLNKEDYFLSFL